MAEKKTDKKSQTKAGMLGKKGNQTTTDEDKDTKEKETENTPKISKEKAEGHHDDKPIH
jgi:hypothetical protein